MNIEPKDIRAAIAYQRQNRILTYFRSTGTCRRELYPKHLEFFAAGARYKERMFMAANRIGKSDAGAFETVAHVTGDYPPWWTGKRFPGPIQAWACGTTNETTLEIVQEKLLGPVGQLGSGLIPARLILGTTPSPHGLKGSVKSIQVRHITGGESTIGLKSYEQGRKSFEGTAKHLIWFDEEPPEEIYTEGLYRTVTTGGITLLTFTPLQGRSAVVNGFLEPETEEAQRFKWYIQAGWAHVPHIPDEEKEALIATTPPYQIKARTEGEPSLGAGAIYPIAEGEIVYHATTVPPSWPRVYALDVGWRRTAALWMARDPGNGQLVLYDEHYQSMGEPASHAAAIKRRGDWIFGVADPASLGASQIDGRKLLEMYRGYGLQIAVADNAVETGIKSVWELFVSGGLKVCPHLYNWWAEFRKYHRSAKREGMVVKADDHLMDCTRYLVLSGVTRIRAKPVPTFERPAKVPTGDRAWMAY